MFKAIYIDSEYSHYLNGRGSYDYGSEEVLGYFESIEDFKEAALERWPNKRDKVVFENSVDGIHAYFEYMGMRARGYIIVNKVEKGWLPRVWGR